MGLWQGVLSEQNEKKASEPEAVSYTHLDVYKRQGITYVCIQVKQGSLGAFTVDDAIMC